MERDLKLNQTVQERQESHYSILSFDFVLDIFFMYISNVNPFPSILSKNPLFSPPPHSKEPILSCFLALVFPYTLA